eukprot:4768502-Ditylum_brightwellii.AAC.1
MDYEEETQDQFETQDDGYYKDEMQQQQEEGHEEGDYMDMDDVPVTQEDAWAVIRYVSFV